MRFRWRGRLLLVRVRRCRFRVDTLFLPPTPYSSAPSSPVVRHSLHDPPTFFISIFSHRITTYHVPRTKSQRDGKTLCKTQGFKTQNVYILMIKNDDLFSSRLSKIRHVSPSLRHHLRLDDFDPLSASPFRASMTLKHSMHFPLYVLRPTSPRFSPVLAFLRAFDPVSIVLMILCHCYSLSTVTQPRTFLSQSVFVFPYSYISISISISYRLTVSRSHNLTCIHTPIHHDIYYTHLDYILCFLLQYRISPLVLFSLCYPFVSFHLRYTRLL